MDELIRMMSEAYINAVRDLEAEIKKLREENEDLRLIIKELREATDTIN